MVDLDMKNVKDASSVLRALQNSLRLKILAVIKKHPGITVMEVYKELRIEQSVASKHLGILRQSGIVRTQREKKRVHYYLNEDSLKIIARLIEQLAGCYVPGVSSIEE